MPVAIKQILLDALKPRELPLVDLAKALGASEGVEEADIIVSEVDSRTETLKITVKGQRINYEALTRVMDRQGVSIRGIDDIHVAKI
jgi:hypothetical protein